MVDWRNNCYIYVMNERELTFKALNQLQFHTGLVAKVTAYGYPHKPNSSDAHIEFDNSSAKLVAQLKRCLLYTSPSPRDRTRSRMPSSA